MKNLTGILWFKVGGREYKGKLSMIIAKNYALCYYQRPKRDEDYAVVTLIGFRHEMNLDSIRVVFDILILKKKIFLSSVTRGKM